MGEKVKEKEKTGQFQAFCKECAHGQQQHAQHSQPACGHRRIAAPVKLK